MIVDDAGAQLRKGDVEYCILGCLEREPMYGWQLSETLVGKGMIASIGTLYPVLGHLGEQGMVSSFEEPSGRGPSRRYYRLTPNGTAQLSAFRKQWKPFAAVVEAIVGEDTEMTEQTSEVANSYLRELDDALHAVDDAARRNIVDGAMGGVIGTGARGSEQCAGAVMTLAAGHPVIRDALVQTRIGRRSRSALRRQSSAGSWCP